MLIVFGHIGSDAGYTYIDSQGNVVHVPGWQPVDRVEMSTALKVLSESSKLKNPGVAKGLNKGVLDYVEKELKAQNITDGVLIFH